MEDYTDGASERSSRYWNIRLNSMEFQSFTLIPHKTSTLCPICGGKLIPNGYRVLHCENCGFESDRDIVGSWNIRLRALKMWGVSVPPRKPANEWRREDSPLQML
ncbi:MAG TPA: hypothetical protein EYG81_04060 [Archaeoglobus profundus]|nr:hypothetical protein [Archaeoglobus profundus]